MNYTTKRTTEHQDVIDDVKRRTEANGIKFKPTPRNHHYYLDETFSLGSKQATIIAGIIGSNNPYSYIGHLGVISTEYPLDDQTIQNVIDQIS